MREHVAGQGVEGRGVERVRRDGGEDPRVESVSLGAVGQTLAPSFLRCWPVNAVPESFGPMCRTPTMSAMFST